MSTVATSAWAAIAMSTQVLNMSWVYYSSQDFRIKAMNWGQFVEVKQHDLVFWSSLLNMLFGLILLFIHVFPKALHKVST